MKLCQHCRIRKSLDEFHKNRQRSDGLAHWCKKCRKEYYITNDANEKSRIRAATPKARARKAIYRKRYDEKYPGRANEQKKKWANENREAALKSKRKYSRNHSEKIKKWAMDNIDRLREYRRLYNANRRKNDVHYKMRHVLAKRVYSALRGVQKSANTEALLGCSIRDFLVYFESRFTDGMTWAGVMDGRIHVDHVFPCASFDLTTEEDQRKCFHFSNLQPLWAKDNRKKSDKILGIQTAGNNAAPSSRVVA